MKAAQRDRYGSPDVIEIREVETPVPTEDRVRVRVEAASVNRADLDQLYPRWQFYRLVAGLRRPRSPNLGLDVAGVVDAIGPDATRLKVGDRVYGDLFSFGMGSFAEFVCARERAFRRIPDAMTAEDAATLPHSAILALQSLRIRGRRLEARQRLLIDGASGNVGPFAIQIAKERGAHVTATCSEAKMAFVRELGADVVLDYRATDYTRTGDRWDWIVDTDSHHSTWDARRGLAPGGVYQTLGGGTADLLGLLFVAPVAGRLAKARLGLMMGWQPFQRAQDDAAEVERLHAAGALRPYVDRRFPLSDTVEALRYVDSRTSKGKVLVIP
ncbi:MAG TPA: NAD(P)-dependent alcohol dehydrogenase [Candidatus Limnocylindrales bacterium]